jgi:uncharacterized cupin superfamily protein
VLAHWDEVEVYERVSGHLRGRWQDLGRAAGSVSVGVKRIRVEPGHWSTPAHVHGRDEEIFFVLAGHGLSWQDGETYEVREGDCLVHLANGRTHTLRAGPDGLDVLAFGTRERDEAAYLPRARVLWLGKHYVDAADPERPPWAREAEAGPPPLPEAPTERPTSIVNLADVPTHPYDRPGYVAVDRQPGDAAGSIRAGLNHQVVEPGQRNCPPHCHSAEEEIFVILDGSGRLELLPVNPPGAEVETHDVRRGHVVSRPPHTRVGHSFVAGDEGLTLLVYGTREPNDIAFYPRSRKVYFRGVGLMTRLEPLDYWEGEEER